jgi:hypothetical protein
MACVEFDAMAAGPQAVSIGQALGRRRAAVAGSHCRHWHRGVKNVVKCGSLRSYCTMQRNHLSDHLAQPL